MEQKSLVTLTVKLSAKARNRRALEALQQEEALARLRADFEMKVSALTAEVQRLKAAALSGQEERQVPVLARPDYRRGRLLYFRRKDGRLRQVASRPLTAQERNQELFASPGEGSLSLPEAMAHPAPQHSTPETP